MDKLIGYFNILVRDRKKLISVIILVLGIFLAVVYSGNKEEKESTSSLSDYKEELEEELTELCSRVEGAGKCRVTVSFSSGESIEYRGSNITGTTPPKVQGVTVLCEGGDNAHVRSAISDAMTALFDIGSNRVSVIKMGE